MVMADRLFTICESVGLKKAKLLIPAFTKGKMQLDPIDVERARFSFVLQHPTLSFSNARDVSNVIKF